MQNQIPFISPVSPNQTHHSSLPMSADQRQNRLSAISHRGRYSLVARSRGYFPESCTSPYDHETCIVFSELRIRSSHQLSNRLAGVYSSSPPSKLALIRKKKTRLHAASVSLSSTNHPPPSPFPQCFIDNTRGFICLFIFTEAYPWEK